MELNGEVPNNSDFIFELIKYDKTSKTISFKKNETLASLYYDAEATFCHKCKLYMVNIETKEESPLLNCNDIILEKFILNNPTYFIPSKENGSYMLNFYEDYYESDSATFQ